MVAGFLLLHPMPAFSWVISTDPDPGIQRSRQEKYSQNQSRRGSQHQCNHKDLGRQCIKELFAFHIDSFPFHPLTGRNIFYFISHTPDHFQILGVFRINFYFFPNVPDMDSYCIVNYIQWESASRARRPQSPALYRH